MQAVIETHGKHEQRSLGLPEETVFVLALDRWLQRFNNFQYSNGVDVNLHVLAGAADFHLQAAGRDNELAIL